MYNISYCYYLNPSDDEMNGVLKELLSTKSADQQKLIEHLLKEVSFIKYILILRHMCMWGIYLVFLPDFHYSSFKNLQTDTNSTY